MDANQADDDRAARNVIREKVASVVVALRDGVAKEWGPSVDRSPRAQGQRAAYLEILQLMDARDLLRFMAETD